LDISKPAIDHLAQIQQQHLAIGFGLDVSDIFVIQRAAPSPSFIACPFSVAAPRASCTHALRLGSDCVLNHMACTEARGVEVNILVNPDGTVVAVRITNQAEAVALFSFREMPLLVARHEAPPAGQNPDLGEVDGIVPQALNSLCEMPVPALMRCTSPGRITEPLPRLSRCSSAPART
jgi:hypothetical protein